MSATAFFWIVIVVLAIGTLLLRSLPMWTHGRIAIPEWLERLLKRVPAAALTALFVPGSLYATHSGAYEFAPARTIAALAALAVALRFKSMLATLSVGMVVLWIAQMAIIAIA